MAGKPAVYVNQSLFLNTVERIESDGPLPNRNALYEAILAEYNRQVKPEEQITKSVVLLRLKEWDVAIKTPVGQRGRAEQQVDQDLLTQSVRQAEINGPLSNRSALYEKVAEIYNQSVKEEDQILPATAMNRIVKWEILVKTPVGQRGRAKGTALTPEHKAKLHAGRRGKKSRYADWDAMRKKTPERYHPLITKVEGGNKRAAIKLHCLECTGYSSKEVHLCTATACVMYSLRPFQKMVEKPLEEENDAA